MNASNIEHIREGIAKLRDLGIKSCVEHVEFLKTEGLIKEDIKNEIEYHLDYNLNEIRTIIPAHLTTNDSKKNVIITTEWVRWAELSEKNGQLMRLVEWLKI